jgi:hypothetical protein
MNVCGFTFVFFKASVVHCNVQGQLYNLIFSLCVQYILFFKTFCVSEKCEHTTCLVICCIFQCLNPRDTILIKYVQEACYNLLCF